jgi:hypothetical protein
MRIRLTRKFAELIDGIDLSRRRVGDVIEIPVREARLLIAEGWAAPEDDSRAGRAVHGNRLPADTVADRPPRRRRQPRR